MRLWFAEYPAIEPILIQAFAKAYPAAEVGVEVEVESKLNIAVINNGWNEAQGLREYAVSISFFWGEPITYAEFLEARESVVREMKRIQANPRTPVKFVAEGSEITGKDKNGHYYFSRNFELLLGSIGRTQLN